MKHAKVIPVHKCGSKTKTKNYRPISLLSTISKIFKAILSTKLLSFFSQHSILIISTQYMVFEKKHNTVHAIQDIVTNVYYNISKNNFSCILALDLKKAFDTVTNETLLKKLEHYGIPGNCNNLIRNYLSNRTQRVCDNNKLSSSRLITCGVPLGSILGPLWFLIYVNYFPQALNNQPRLYADDTRLIVSDRTTNQLEQSCVLELNNAERWMQINYHLIFINPLLCYFNQSAKFTRIIFLPLSNK